MALSIDVIDAPSRLGALTPEWLQLAERAGASSVLGGPVWCELWLGAYGAALEATPQIVAVRDSGSLIGVAPLYARTTRVGPGVKARELRFIGDAGPRPPSFDLLAAPGSEAQVAAQLAAWLSDGRTDWDLADLAPLKDPSRARAHLAERLEAVGRKVESQEASATLTISLAPAQLSPQLLPPLNPRFAIYDDDAQSQGRGVTALRRLSRLEWAAQGELSPLADAEGSRMLADVLARLRDAGKMEITRVDGAHGEPSAVAVSAIDGARGVVLALAVDPEEPAAGGQLIAAIARRAAMAKLRALDVISGAADVEPPPLPTSIKPALRLRAFNTTKTGALARTVASLRRKADAVQKAPGQAAAGARAAWARVRGAAASATGYERLHLYRGELWTRAPEPPPGIKVVGFGPGELEALEDGARRALLARLELDETGCLETWSRGDLAVLAMDGDRPVGVAWCARAAAWVPELGREVKPGPGECYIHDVFVAEDARGKSVAPSMLEALARRLRQADVYRAWALIRPANVASQRAFEKAAYAAVCDVIHARLGGDRIILRPSDAGAQRLFGVES